MNVPVGRCGGKTARSGVDRDASCSVEGGTMPKNIIFCADGTWNGPGNDNMADQATNVFRLFVNLDGEDDIGSTLLANEQERNLTVNGTMAQCAKYLHGVGDSHNVLIRLLGGTVGAGLIARIVRGYTTSLGITGLETGSSLLGSVAAPTRHARWQA